MLILDTPGPSVALGESRREGIVASTATKLLQHYGTPSVFFESSQADNDAVKEPPPERKMRVRKLLGKYLDKV